MKMIPTLSKAATLFAAAFVLAIPATTSFAQATLSEPAPRLTAPIDNATRATLPGTLLPLANAANDAGAVPPSTPLTGITLVFNRTPAQQQALDTLLAALQNSASPQYHQWLTPAQFGARFGLAPSDIAAVQNWLQSQGFTVEGVSNSRDRIRFSGTAAQAEAAFGAPIHYFKVNGQTHFAPAAALSLPAAIAPDVLTVLNLSNFRPLPHYVRRAPFNDLLANPNFTSSQSGSYFTDPKDLETIYNATPSLSSGYIGTGVTIAVVGQSAIQTTDITNFQTALGVANHLPTLILEPNTGTSTINPDGDGDEGESDLDLEYTSSIATGATIDFVYTGNSSSGGAFDAIIYAVDNKIGQIISSSYGDCEPDLGQANYNTLNAALAQAAAQGQTVISAAGDSGSEDCYGNTDLNTTGQEALAVDFPASSQYVTALGGSEFLSADVTVPNTTYWTSSTGTDVISSAKSYIPEQAWNDDVADGTLASGGGGASIYTARPSWQTGVTGIAFGSNRLVPDISLDAGLFNASLLYCSSDPDTGINGSCSHGFRDASNEYLTTAGGTSFAAPTFAAFLAILNQAKGDLTGQGVVNPTLYTLASSSTTYASAFHDIQTGGNYCLVAADCSTAGAADFPTTVGYDEATGLGSLNLANLITAWPGTNTSPTTPTTLTITAATTTPGISQSDLITVTVSSTTGTPTGGVTIAVNGTTVATPTLTNGTATYTFSEPVSGTFSVSATYAGTTTYSAASNSITIAVAVPSFSLTASTSSITVNPGATGTISALLAPTNAYTGFVTVTASGPSAVGGSIAFCIPSTGENFTSSNNTAPITLTFPVYTSQSSAASCLSSGGFGRPGKPQASNKVPSPWRNAPLPIAFAGLLLLGVSRRRFRKARLLKTAFALALTAILGLGASTLTGCSNAATGASLTAPAGTYVITLTASDTNGNSSSANVTVVIP